MTPEMESVSWVMAVTSAVEAWASAATARRRAPTARVSSANTGTVPTATSVSSQERTSMAMRVLMKMTLLESTLETVVVTTVCTPPTSLAIRDCTSPVRVSVKNLSDRLWRCR